MKDKDTLEIVREIQAKPEAVFHALTRPDELAQWWTGMGGIKHAEVDLRVGGAYAFEFRIPDDKTVVMRGEFRVVDPPRRFAMTWVSPKHPNLHTVVAFEIEPIPTGSRLTIRHSGLSEPDAYRGHEAGWIAALTLLVQWLAMAPMLARGGTSSSEDR